MVVSFKEQSDEHALERSERFANNSDDGTAKIVHGSMLKIVKVIRNWHDDRMAVKASIGCVKKGQTFERLLHPEYLSNDILQYLIK